jgi:hypothetical protein
MIFLSGCLFDETTNRKVIGSYHLETVNGLEDLQLTYKKGGGEGIYNTIIPSTVFAVGNNQKYIIAKRHPCSGLFTVDKSITEYYILPITDTIDWKNIGLIGPLNLKEFDEKRNLIGIQDIKFTITYSSVE